MRKQSRGLQLILALAFAALLSAPPVAAQTPAQEPPAAAAGEPSPGAATGQNEKPAAESAAPQPGAAAGVDNLGKNSDRPADAAAPAMAQPASSEPAAPPTNSEPPAPSTAPTPAAANPEPAPLPAQASPAPAPTPIDPKDITLKIATWGGAYGEAQDRAYFKPFNSRFGYQVKTVIYDGHYDRLKEQGETPEWSLVDLNGEAATRACNDQLLEHLDPSIVETAPNGASAPEDFLPGAIQPCGIASVAWSAVIVYDRRLKQKPGSVEDFFNTKRFPGKRILPKQPSYSLELALMADGVKPDAVYSTLATPEGQDRAFAKLSSIKDDIVWWEKPSEVFGRIAAKEAVMGIGFNGRAFMAIVGAREPVEILWDHQIYSFDYWGIPRGAAHQDAAKAFIRFATSPGPLADQTRWLPYGPARRSAVELVGKHAELDLEMKPFLPTYAPNMSSALAFDASFWAANEATLTTRFDDWVTRRQLPLQREPVTSQ
ncbi:MAG: extracellular solute-binding protein [Rhodomicrobiaceae bacterium]